jgi:hypothetical protein
MTQQRDNGMYQIPAALVTRLIVTIITSISFVGGYMVLWALNDAQWKGTWQKQIEVNSHRLDALEHKVYGNPPAKTE